MISILANIGVIAGIVFLAFELSQNTASNRGAAYQTWVTANLALNSSLIEIDTSGAIAAGMSDSANLTPDTQLPFAMWHLGFFQQIQATYFLRQTGTIDQALWEAELHRAALHLSLPGVREWWDAGARTQLAPEFVEVIEATQSQASAWNWVPNSGFVSD